MGIRTSRNDQPNHFASVSYKHAVEKTAAIQLSEVGTDLFEGSRNMGCGIA